MKAIGIKDLKARLSEHLRSVRLGETLLVTDRSEVIAELRPSNRRAPAPDSLADALDALAERGEVARARSPKGAWQWKPKGLGLPTATARHVLDALRADHDEV
jgi:antitoxin (DNA-binding transcriptional repressor) of toxin-antitoxin stability system